MRKFNLYSLLLIILIMSVSIAFVACGDDDDDDDDDDDSASDDDDDDDDTGSGDDDDDDTGPCTTYDICETSMGCNIAFFNSVEECVTISEEQNAECSDPSGYVACMCDCVDTVGDDCDSFTSCMIACGDALCP